MRSRLTQVSCALGCLASLWLAACGDSNGPTPVDGGPRPDLGRDTPAETSGEVPGTSSDAETGGDVPGPSADAGGDLPPGVPPRVHATWPVPDPSVTAGATAQRYQIMGDVVFDPVTNLTWQRAVAPNAMEWQAAGAYCAALVLGGRDDWRLPARIELVSLVDFTRHTPTINLDAFPDTPSAWFWTSSTLADIPGFAWYVYFETGFSQYIDETFEYRVRCVSGTPTAWPGYTLTADTVSDPGTGLQWQRNIDDVERTYAEATALCAARPGGWRLPTMKEMQTIVDESRASPAIDPTAFPDTPSESFWSATRFVPIPSNAWRTSFERGYTYDSMDDATYRTRCVRTLPR